MTIKARSISGGKGHGKILISSEPISFLSGVNAETGVVQEEGHPLQGLSIEGKVLAFPYGKGSTVGSYVMYALKKNGKAPAALINTETEPIIAVGAIMAHIPMVDRPEIHISELKTGAEVCVDGDQGLVTVEE